MRSSYSSLMQSRFFNPAFNSAIFDGPLRIYFSQAHESFALKVYLQAQGGLTEEVKACRDSHGIKQILIMVYPSDEAFAMSFDNVPSEPWVQSQTEEGHLVFGLRGPLSDELLPQFIQKIKQTIFELSSADLRGMVTQL